jgi:MFS family permease
LLGDITPWHLLAVATAAGIVNAIDLPARLAFVIDMVGRDDLPNAIALNSMLFNLARVLGPIVSGVLFYLAGGGKWGKGRPACVSCLMDSASWPCSGRWLGWSYRPKTQTRSVSVEEVPSLTLHLPSLTLQALICGRDFAI